MLRCRTLLPLLLLLAAPAQALSPAVVQHRLGQAEGALEAVEIAAGLQDPEALDEALGRRGVPAGLLAWHQARRAADGEEVVRAWKRARRHRSDLRVDGVDLAPDFDRFVVQALLETGRIEEAARHHADPLGAHPGDDPVWTALEGGLLLAQGELSNATLRLDQAWRRADPLQRRHHAFARRALAHAAAGDPAAAAEAWLDWVRGLRRAAEKDRALRVWDRNPLLAGAMGRAALRDQAAEWVAGQARREEALALARWAWEEGDGRESRRGYFLMAEQLYRLRRHEELLAHLEQKRPDGLQPEERAALDAYPWGVRRRSGSSEEVARGFDQVVAAHAGTARAVEALWEAAWMWELSGRVEVAEERFLRYAEDHPHAPFAEAAALRALYLPWRQGRCEAVAQRLERLRPALGDDRQEAASLWIATRCDEGSPAAEELARRHPDSPLRPRFQAPLSPPRDEPPEELSASLYQDQVESFRRVGREVGVEDPFRWESPSLVRADRLYAWGLLGQGDAALERAVEEAEGDAGRLRCVALAFAHGRSERQARLAWRLQHRLRGRDPELDDALDRIYYPTPYVEAVLDAAVGEGLPAGLLWGLMRRESFFEADVVSHAGAYGLMQLLPSTAERMARALDEEPPARPRALFVPGRNLRYGSHYLGRLLEESGGDPFQALASYNAGEGNGARWKGRLPEGAPPQELLLLISYSETRAYVYHVLRAWQLYGRIHPVLGRWDGLGNPGAP